MYKKKAHHQVTHVLEGGRFFLIRCQSSRERGRAPTKGPRFIVRAIDLEGAASGQRPWASIHLGVLQWWARAIAVNCPLASRTLSPLQVHAQLECGDKGSSRLVLIPRFFNQ